MSWTKREFITAAFDELGMASYVYDLQPEEMQSALKKLDAMIAQWNAKGFRLRYPLPLTPLDSDLNNDTGIPDSANEAVITNLAMRIAPSYGKTVSVDTKSTAKKSYNTVASIFAHPIDRDATNPPVLIGAGDKPWRNGYVSQQQPNIAVGGDDYLGY